MRPSLKVPLLFSRAQSIPLLYSPALWLDASNAASRFQDSALTTPAAADADPVGGWKDLSGNSRNITQATANARPTLKLAIQNGKPVIRFDGVDDTLATANGIFSTLTAGEVFAVVKEGAGPPHGLWSWTGAVDSGYYKFNATDIYERFGSTVRYGAITATVSTTQFNVYNVYSAANDWQAFLNGTSQSVQGVNTVTFAQLLLGKNPTGGTFGNHDWGELVFFPRKLEASQRANMNAYLRNKWATP